MTPVKKHHYERINVTQWLGTMLITLENLTTVDGILPKGSKVTVVGKWKGFQVATSACTQCQRYTVISHIPHWKLASPEQPMTPKPN